MYLSLALSHLDLVILMYISATWYFGVGIVFSLFQYLFTMLVIVHLKNIFKF